MPRRNRPQLKRRRPVAHTGAGLDTQTIRRRTVETPPAPVVRVVRACIICAQPLPPKWHHPEHSSCFHSNPNRLTQGENNR